QVEKFANTLASSLQQKEGGIDCVMVSTPAGMKKGEHSVQLKAGEARFEVKDQAQYAVLLVKPGTHKESPVLTGLKPTAENPTGSLVLVGGAKDFKVLHEAGLEFGIVPSIKSEAGIHLNAETGLMEAQLAKPELVKEL